MTPCGLRLKRIGTLIAQRRMPPLAYCKPFRKVVDDQGDGLRPRVSGWLLREAFIFEAREHPPPAYRVIRAIALSDYTADRSLRLPGAAIGTNGTDTPSGPADEEAV